MGKLLVPVDGSDAATHAATFAARVAHESGMAVTLLHVFDVPSVSAMGMAALSKEEIQQARERVARGSFDRARSAMGAAGEKASTETALGDPAAEIMGIARKGEFDQIIMGSRGLGPLNELLLGSVSEKVIRHAHCPVTIVR